MAKKNIQLKKLQLLGFKSFADKTKLEFDPGISAIVGPNGCGKSNIADAFRWVLGEQSAKSMRGNKMPDVIFAGTAHRKPLNYAEVTITLSNPDRALPIDYEEISVARRLHRSGESEYFLNNQVVRLKDLQSLFLDSGIGKSSFSIFEQGKIDQVINFSPLERRHIFEEAAGILRFLQRKREALRKLESTDENISRVKDIHKEVEKQIIVLEEQSEKARLFKEHKAKLEELEKGILAAKWEQIQKRRTDTAKKEEEQTAILQQNNQAVETLQKKLGEAKAQLAEAEKALRSRSEEVFKTRSDKEIKTREKQTAQERLKESSTKEKRWQSELEALIQKRESRKSEFSQAQKLQKALEKDVLALEKERKKQNEKVGVKDAEVTKFREKQQSSQQELVKLLQSESQVQSELKQNTVRLENIQERQAQLLERNEKMSGIEKGFLQQAQEKDAQVKELTKGIDKQKTVFQELEDKTLELTDQIEQSQTDLDGLSQEISEGKARLKALLRLRDDLEGFSEGSKRLLQESTNPKSALHSKLKGLYELTLPEEGMQAPLAAALSQYAQTLVVDTIEDYKTVLAFAKQHKLHDYSLICLESVQTAKKSSTKISGLLSLLSHVTENTLSKHLLQEVFIAENVDEAFKIIRKNEGIEVWSKDNVFIDRNQVCFYLSQGKNNVFLREAEIKTLESKLGQMEKQKTQCESSLKALQQKRAQYHSEMTEADKQIRKSEMRLVEVNFALQRANGDLEKAKKDRAHLQTELSALASAIEKLNELIADLHERHKEAKAKALQTEKNSTAIHEDLQQLTTSLKSEQQLLQVKEAEFQKVVDELRKAEHAIYVIEIKDIESKQQEQRLEEEIQMAKEFQSQIKNKGSEFDQALQEVEQLLGTVVAACEGLEKETVKWKKAIEEVEKQIQVELNKNKQKETERYQTGILAAQLESSQQSIENDLLEKYQLTTADALKLNIRLEKSIEQTEKWIKSIKQEMEAAGDINMTSIEECAKHKTRYDFLNNQIDDLGGAKQELIQIITELDTESRKIFQDTFALISANFKKNFKILFNGGEADLQFTETEDILEAGIEIIAKPPGKQMRSISLLSGGEKCMTALALLFAIFEVKPAPFCVLDEIDAPLDDSNVERFVNVVKQFIDRCQFIIITHNKRTMAIADVLFGVSMEERGVSKILQMEFAQAAEPQLV